MTQRRFGAVGPQAGVGPLQEGLQRTCRFQVEKVPNDSVEECKALDATYSALLHVRASLINQETGEVKEQDVFMGDFPLVTNEGTFIIREAERVNVSKLVRSPRMWIRRKRLFLSTVIPNRGVWLECETDAADPIGVRGTARASCPPPPNYGRLDWGRMPKSGMPGAR